MVAKSENVKWVDGLRGLASVSVVITHIARAFSPEVFNPNIADPAAPENVGKIISPTVLQWPIIRVFIQGRLGIAIFALVTGYVCALKPIRQSKAGNIEGALASVAKSAFRRIPRLFLPTTLATFLIWIMTQMHFFQVARNSESQWLSYTGPNLDGTWAQAVRALFRETMRTWTNHQNSFDANQWTLQPLLKGSMMIYIVLVGTMYCQQKFRMMISFAFYVFFYYSGEVTFNMQFFFGMFLSDLSNHQPTLDWINQRKWIRRVMPTIFMVIGMWLCSYPESNASWTGWSAQLDALGNYLCWMGQSRSRLFTGLGMDFICLAIFVSPQLKDWLSSKYLLWLGKHSFAVYLIHGTLIRSVMSWVMYGMKIPGFHEEEREGKIVMVGDPRLTALPLINLVWIVPPFFVLTYALAHFWTNYVDPFCAKVTFKFEQFTKVHSEKSAQGQGLLQQPVGGQ